MNTRIFVLAALLSILANCQKNIPSPMATDTKTCAEVQTNWDQANLGQTELTVEIIRDLRMAIENSCDMKNL